ncbi:helix-turn-helix transcriptional regulator [Spiribacter vilamensis]|uniref:Putative DNA-binding transcriptional regulator YafY n=1 Tax=Spiribacter vilamensis TaxID=531306 RepID=A0A4Q8D0I6_9GAMM|nr:WYL domain-containing protein [Spiribacter vilamensis]RZU98730.1 putative DNA-binding transcriptional regulator YafY [Spiribacter vilamensis]TVO62246.1 WYL domain-containing protein [Spiribacter vilamensis]
MTDTTLRYITMLRMIPRYPRTITANRLRDGLHDHGFEVDLRTIQRDLGRLSAWFPLIADEDTRPYGWAYDAEATSNMIPALDLPAALTLELARAYLTPVLPQRALRHLKPHFEEAQQTLERQHHPLGKWPDQVRVINRGLMTQRPAVDGAVLEIVSEALLRERQCELRYQARHWDRPETIRVHPYGLILRDPNIYLVCRIDGREGVRQLVLHRASDATLREAPAEEREDFDLDNYIQSGAMGQLLSDQPIRLELRCDRPVLSHIEESPLGDDQVIEPVSADQFHVIVTVSDTQDLRWWLMAQAPHLDIRAPAWLREAVVEKLNAAVQRQAGI